MAMMAVSFAVQERLLHEEHTSHEAETNHFLHVTPDQCASTLSGVCHTTFASARVLGTVDGGQVYCQQPASINWRRHSRSHKALYRCIPCERQRPLPRSS